MRRWEKIELKVLLLGLAILALVVVVVSNTGEVAEPPSSSSSERLIARAPQEATAAGRAERLHPGGDIEDCLRCHVRPDPPPQQIEFCTQCHPLRTAHGSAPTPAHPVRFGARAEECWFCHRPHRGLEARNHAANGKAGFCSACHISREGIKGEVEVGESCAQCHNLGLSADHRPVAEGGAKGCEECHKMMR